LLKGFYVQDQLSFGEGNNQQIPFVFGCHFVESGILSSNKADGIIGMIHHDHPTIYEAYYAAGLIDSPTFSLCLGINGGTMTLGGYNDGITVSNASVHVLHSNETQYFGTNIQGISLNGTNIISASPNSGGKQFAAFDSGSTYTYFPEDIFNEITLSMSSFCSEENFCGSKDQINVNNQSCFYYLPISIPSLKDFYHSFPIIRIYYSGEEWISWYPSEYLVAYGQSSLYTIYCAGFIHPNFAPFHNHSFNSFIFGATFLRQQTVLFDYQNAKIMFIKSVCSNDPNKITEDYEPVAVVPRISPDVLALWAIITIALVAAAILMLIICCIVSIVRKARRGAEAVKSRPSQLYRSNSKREPNVVIQGRHSRL